MEAGHIKWFELVIVFAVVIGWGAWELWSLRRDRRRAKHADRKREDRTPSE
jgi:ABC-type nickel/cobalt efflux system permease component RcnA